MSNTIRLLFVLTLVLAACAMKPADSVRVMFETRSPVWLDQLGDNSLPPAKGRGFMLMPEGAAGPVSAVIILHSSLGLGTLEWDFAEALQKEGTAVFLVDSFSMRGVTKITNDQTAVTEASMFVDLYKAYELLRRDARIDGSRIAVAGFSKGALPALYSSFTNMHRLYGYESDPFAAHLAFYPWCGLSLYDWQMSGAPVQIHIGREDDITPAQLCVDLMAAVERQSPDAPLGLHVYEGQGHAFNHPGLDKVPFLPIGYKIPKDCRIEQRAEGTFTEMTSGQILNSRNYAKVLQGCTSGGGFVFGDIKAGQEANGRALAFLLRELGL